VERLSGEVGSKVTLGDVLLIGSDEAVRIGAPTLAGASVVGTIVAQDRAAKVMTFKQKRRKGYRRKYGHRQDYTEIRVDQIQG
jgi:large subunit ribosomal protein L21